MELKIEYVDINSIKPYKNNAKQHPREQIEQIKKSIQEFGFNDPIAVWNNEIVEGHGRYLALQELGGGTIPIIRLDNLTNEQRKAYTLVHNKLTMNSDFDIDMLEEELKELGELDISLEDYGFDTNIEIELDDGLEQKKEEQELNVVDPSSFIYMGAVSVYGETGDSIIYYDIDKDLANKIIKVIEDKGENVVSEKIMEALNGL